MEKLKFNINDKVRVRATGRLGTVIGYKYEIHLEKGVKTTKVQYSVNFGTYLIDVFKEEQITHEFEFDKKFEIGFLNLLIDIYLSNKHRNLKMVKYLHDLKQEHLGVKE